jgi:ABC-2 type transport system permease protein
VFSETWKKISPVVMCENNFLRNTPRVGITQMCDDMDAEILSPPIKREAPDNTDDLQNETIYQELIPSFTVMFVFFLVTIMGRSFIHERELGTLRRLRLAPIGGASLLTGKTIPFLVISIVQTALLFLCGRLLFQMEWGTYPLLLLPVAFCTSLSATALGLLVSTIVRTESQVSAYANTVVITMAGISGCFMPRKWLPDAMRTLSLGTPHAWALMAYNEILNRTVPNFILVAQCCGWLIAFTLLYFALGTWRFTRTA